MAVETAPTQTKALVTGEELLDMGDIGPSELVEGRVVLMSPTGRKHGRYEGRFYKYLEAFVEPQKLGEVSVGEVGIYIRRNPDTVRAADVIFISTERLAQQKQEEGFLEIAPELVVEVMSPTDRWSDVKQKLREYFSIGVKLVWVADPTDRTVEAYRSLTDVREFKEADTLIGDDVLPGFSVAVASLFEE